MFRLLVVEDQTEFYEDYLLRLFERLLPLDKIAIVHVPSLEAALTALQEPWDFILMDYSLGSKTEFLGDPVRDGADLVAFRRAFEKQQKQSKAFILGISSNFVGNTLMHKRGANQFTSKLDVEEMASQIKKRLVAADE